MISLVSWKVWWQQCMQQQPLKKRLMVLRENSGEMVEELLKILFQQALEQPKLLERLEKMERYRNLALA